MSNNISSGIKNIFLNGINLNLESIEEEEHYMLYMNTFFEEETEFTAYLNKDGMLEVETKELQLGMQIQIINSTLFMVPYVHDVFEIFAEVLKFIAEKHQIIVTEFRGFEETKIESLKDIENFNNVKENKKEEESSDDDDYEWI